jgi:DNA mismatch endonuclease (patch repair protein)
MPKHTLSTDPRRSAMMGRVRQRGTAAELTVRKILRAHGYGYRVCVPNMPGKPDIVLTRYHTAIFVNGCFWHGHAGCPRATVPKTHVQFWKRKIAANRARDAKVTAELEALECELADVNRLVQRLKESLALLSVELLQKKEEGAGNA